MTTTKINSDRQTHKRLHLEESQAFGDAGYQGGEKQQDSQGSKVASVVAPRPAKRKASAKSQTRRLDEQIERIKASAMTKVHVPFYFVKNLF